MSTMNDLLEQLNDLDAFLREELRRECAKLRGYPEGAEFQTVYRILAALGILWDRRKDIIVDVDRDQVFSTDTQPIKKYVEENDSIPDHKKSIVVALLDELDGTPLTRDEAIDRLLDIQSELTIGANCRCGGDHVGRLASAWDCVRRYWGKGVYHYIVDVDAPDGRLGYQPTWRVSRVRRKQFPMGKGSSRLACGGWSSGRSFLSSSYLGIGPATTAVIMESPMRFPDPSSAMDFAKKLSSGQPLSGWKAASILMIGASIFASIAGAIVELVWR